MKNYAKAFLKAISLVALLYCCFQCTAPITSSQDQEELAPYVVTGDSIKRVSLDALRAGAKWKKNKLYTICVNATLQNPDYQYYRLLIEESDGVNTYPVAKIASGAGTVQVSYLHRRADFVPLFSIIFFTNGGYRSGTITTTPDEVPDCGIYQAVTDKLKSASVSNSTVLVTIDEK